jgi:hypothetical protein
MKPVMSLTLVLVGVLGLTACGPAEDASVEANSAPLERPVPFDRDLIFEFEGEPRATAAEIAQAKVERAQDACGPCRSRACRMLCILGEDYERAPERPQGDEDDCLMCGRETGFLPRPDLRYEIVAPGMVRFEWDPVEGAEDYTLFGVRWRNDATMTSEFNQEWETPAHSIEVQLETGAGYTFSLKAFANDGEQRSLPSEPVDVEL